MDTQILRGCLPALMTPCNEDRQPNFDALARKGRELVNLGMSGVVYCGSMGDWPLLTDAQRQAGVEALVAAQVPVIVGTGAINTHSAVDHARHAQSVGAAGLMVIPRVLSRGISPDAQKAHFKAILSAAPNIPAIIYNSPYYGFATRADLFFELRREHPNLVGFKEFGGASDLSYAAETITCASDDLLLLIGVDTNVYHGFVNCQADGAITGIGNALPREILHLDALCRSAAAGDPEARAQAKVLNEALHVLSTFDEGPDLVLFYKHLLVIQGESEYRHHFVATDALSDSQRGFVEAHFKEFRAWYDAWVKDPAVAARKPS